MENGLKNIWKNLKIGAAVNSDILKNKQADEIIKKHFSSLTTENSMKWGPTQPKENIFFWEETDIVADYARKNKIDLRGHTIIWHNQNPHWLFDDNGIEVSKLKLQKRLEAHAIALTQRYNDIVTTWDVLNEVIETDKGDENGKRQTLWYKICGNEIYEFAFKLMRELSPNSKLYFNDYNNESGAKMDATIRFLSSMLDKGVPIDGVGLQGHWYYNYPDENILRKAFESYSSLGLEIELTEVDISLYEWDEKITNDNYFKTAPEERVILQAERYKEIFSIASEYPAVKCITTWGVADNHTWLDDFPVPGRKNWPLLFDEQLNPKPVVKELIKLVYVK